MIKEQLEIWKSIWLAQDKRCAMCKRRVKLEDTGKSSYSLKIVCRTCYNKPNVMVILDELAMELNIAKL